VQRGIQVIIQGIVHRLSGCKDRQLLQVLSNRSPVLHLDGIAQESFRQVGPQNGVHHSPISFVGEVLVGQVPGEKVHDGLNAVFGQDVAFKIFDDFGVSVPRLPEPVLVVLDGGLRIPGEAFGNHAGAELCIAPTTGKVRMCVLRNIKASQDWMRAVQVAHRWQSLLEDLLLFKRARNHFPISHYLLRKACEVQEDENVCTTRGHGTPHG